jgi:hypothetical protein
MVVRGRIRRTLLRGVTVLRDGQVIGTPRGQLLRPPPRATTSRSPTQH